MFDAQYLQIPILGEKYDYRSFLTQPVLPSMAIQNKIKTNELNTSDNYHWK